MKKVTFLHFNCEKRATYMLILKLYPHSLTVSREQKSEDKTSVIIEPLRDSSEVITH